MSSALVKPTSRNICNVVAPICSMGSEGYPGKAIDGIATSFSRSSMTPGIRARALSAISSACMVSPSWWAGGAVRRRGQVGSEEDPADQRADGDGHHGHDEDRDEEAVVEQLRAELGRAREVEVGCGDLRAVRRQGVDAAQGAGP